MCLGLAAQIIASADGHPDLALVDLAGVRRTINIGLLDQPVGPGDWVLVHMGFALDRIPPDQVAEVLGALDAATEQRRADRQGQPESVPWPS